MAKGQKICPKCLSASGPRTKKCKCGFDFPIKYAPEKAAERRAKVKQVAEVKCGPPLLFTCDDDWGNQLPKLPQKLNENNFKDWLKIVKDTPIKLPPFLNGAWAYFACSGVRTYLQKRLKKANFEIVQKWLSKHWERWPAENINRNWGISKWYSSSK